MLVLLTRGKTRKDPNKWFSGSEMGTSLFDTIRGDGKIQINQKSGKRQMIKRKFQLILSLMILSQKVLLKAAADKIWMLCCKEKDGITNRKTGC